MKKLLALILSIIMVVGCLPLSTAFAEARPGSAPETAIEAKLKKTYSYTWAYENNSDSDLWVKLTLSKKGVLTFNGSKLMDTMGEEDYVNFKVFKENDTQNPIWKSSNSRYKLQTKYKIDIPLAAGTYYFTVSDMWLSYNEAPREFEYSFEHLVTSSYETEPNSNINLANTLSFEKRIYAYNSYDDDAFKITVSKDTPARIKIGNLDKVDVNSTVKVTFPDGDYEGIYTSYGTVKASGYYYKDVLLKKGTNVITVSSNYGADAKYWIEVSKDISIGTPKITSVKKKDRDLIVEWGNVAGASGYEVWRKIGKDSWTNQGDVTSNGFEQWFTDFSKSYQFKIRAYVKVGSYGGKQVKVYGGWSTIKSINPTPTNIKLSKTEYTYNGKTQKPTVKIKDVNGKTLTLNKDYTVKYPSGMKKAGTYKIKITFKGDYTGTKTVSYKIKGINVSKCKISLSKTSYTYNGKVQKPTVTVKSPSGSKLSTSSYTVTYAKGRKNVGTYKVTVKMKGNYAGTKTLTFKINPPKTSVSKLTAAKKAMTVKITKKSSQVTGYQIQYSTAKTFKSYKTKNVTNYKTTKVTVKSLSAKKTYYVRVRTYKTVSGKKYYSAWSAAKKVKTK